MDAEQRTLDAITITRKLMRDALNNPNAVLGMTDRGLTPEDVENQICEILEYLDKTKPKKPEEAEAC